MERSCRGTYPRRPRKRRSRSSARFAQVTELLLSLESGPKTFDTGIPLYRSETHTLQAIGREPGINITRLAERMGVTKGAVSQTVAKLVKKKLVRKRPSPSSGRELELDLTALGWRGYHAHEHYHAEAFAAAREYFGDELSGRLDATRLALVDLIGVVEVFKRRTADS